MAGGLGGFGGYDFGGVLGALGQSLLVSPRENPFQGLPQALQATAQQREHLASLNAMSAVAEKLGIPKEIAANPIAMSLLIEQMNTEKSSALTKQYLGQSSELTPPETEQPGIRIPPPAGGLGGLGGPSGPAAAAGAAAPLPKLPAFADIQGAAPSGKIASLVAQAAQRYGQDPATLIRTAQVESGMNPNAQNPNSSAGGLLQFTTGTAKQYGLTNKKDPVASADAGARLMRDNASFLRQKLGRDPAPWELYLAHQQGAGGAAKLLGNPGARAAALVGADAVRLNGGRTDMTAAQFAGLWHKKFGDLPQAAQRSTGLLAAASGASPAWAQVDAERRAKGIGTDEPAPYQVASSAKSIPVPINPPAMPAQSSAPERPPGDNTTKKWAQEKANLTLKRIVVAAQANLPGVVEAEKDKLAIYMKYLTPSEQSLRVREAGLDGTPLGRTIIAGAPQSLQEDVSELTFPGYQSPASRERAKMKLEERKVGLESEKFDYDRYKTDREYQRLVDQGIQTTTTKDYDAYAKQELSQGRTPKSRLDYSISLARAGSPQPEGVEDVERAKGVTAFLNKQAERAPSVAQRSADLDMLSRVINKTATGRGANLKATLDAFAAELGMSTGTFASQKDLIDSITNRIAPSLRDPGSGAQSDSELRGFLVSMPHLAGTPGGNELIQSVLRRSSDIDNKRADIAAQWQAGDLTAKEARKFIADLDRTSIFASPKERELVDRIMGGLPDQQINPPDKAARGDTIETLKQLPESKYGRTADGNWYQMVNGKLKFIRKD